MYTHIHKMNSGVGWWGSPRSRAPAAAVAAHASQAGQFSSSISITRWY